MNSAAANRADAAAREGTTTDTALSPVRILVQTYTHLVPGTSRPDRLGFLRKTIAQCVLETTHKNSTGYLHVYDDLFAVPGRQCFFLYDYAAPPVGADVADDAIPLLWYRWTGEQLIALNQTPPKKIRRTIKEDYKFMIKARRPQIPKNGARDASKEEVKRQRMGETPEARTKRRRELLQAKLRRLDYLFSFEHEWVAGEPEQEAWLKENVEPRAWSWYQSRKAEWTKAERLERLARRGIIDESTI